MLKAEIIGHIGADVEIKVTDGRKFAAFRVAHTDKWKGQDGVIHEQTDWVDITSDAESPVNQFLTKGKMVYVRGSLSKRVYSSAKDRCMKAGLSIRAQEIYLLSPKEKPQNDTTTPPESGKEESNGDNRDMPF